jgi:hypothetical protein
MILGTIRKHLTRDDAQFAVSLLAHGAPSERDALEEALRHRGLDAILDDPRLADALLNRPSAAHASLPLLVYVLVRRTLRDAGEPDRGLADFVSGIVLHFGLRDRANRIREHDDVRYDSLAGLVADAECSDPTRAFLVRAHLGHYALWLAGLFPDRIEAQRHRRGGPDLEYFDEMGRRGYLMAAEHRLAAEHGVNLLFETAAERFFKLRVALNRLSDRVFFPSHHTADRLLRQVRDEGRWH